MPEPSTPDLPLSDLVLDALPEHVQASLESRDRWLSGLGGDAGGLEFLVTDTQSWMPGQTVRVAFAGGTPQLCRDIAEAARPLTDAANLVLDFGEPGEHRTWSAGDTSYAAEIRVGFAQKGYFSLVGTTSVDPAVGLPGEAVGGRPGQCSLNLGGFEARRPANWRGVVRHEFLHALGFHHEHQNMRGPCELAFRWDDDLGYQPTQDAYGMYTVDANGMRPGIYTFLSGHPNGWTRARVDANLRTPRPGAGLLAGPFDPASVMLYRFPPLFYRHHPSPCAPVGDGETLSDGDRRGLAFLYPGDDEGVAGIAERRRKLADTLDPGAASGDNREHAGAGVSRRARDLAAILRASLAAERR